VDLRDDAHAPRLSLIKYRFFKHLIVRRARNKDRSRRTERGAKVSPKIIIKVVFFIVTVLVGGVAQW